AAAFRGEKVIVSAPPAFRVAAADARARLVNGAAPLVRVEEHAGSLEDVVLLMAKRKIAVDQLCVPFFSPLVSDSEVIRQPCNVSAGNVDGPIRTAIAGAPGAVIHDRQRSPVRLFLHPAVSTLHVSEHHFWEHFSMSA